MLKTLLIVLFVTFVAFASATGHDDDDDDDHGNNNGNNGNNNNGNNNNGNSALSNLVNQLAIKMAVREAQFTYNRDIDRAFTIGLSQGNPPTAKFNASIDRIMTHFCRDQTEWHSFVDQIDSPNATTWTAIKGLYTLFSALPVWQNFSRHEVNNEIVTPYVVNGVQFAQLHCMLVQHSTRGVFPFYSSFGQYNNIWRLNNDGSWCMTNFKSTTTATYRFLQNVAAANLVLNPDVL
jgi:hypothetical protein